ncbi:MAG: GatB/YqeY domain-containing protein [Chloroflexota bacterium]
MEPTVRERLESDMKDAMRAGDAQTRDAIRYILSAVKNAEIDARVNPGSFDAVATLRKVGKQLSDAIDHYRAGARDDLAAKEEAQLLVLQRYLPAELSDADLAALADEAAAAIGASGPKDMGKLMPALIAKVEGRAAGGRISAAARDALARIASAG